MKVKVYVTKVEEVEVEVSDTYKILDVPFETVVTDPDADFLYDSLWSDTESALSAKGTKYTEILEIRGSETDNPMMFN